jgi:uncharacterized protein YneR
MKRKICLVELAIFLVALFYTLPAQGQETDVIKEIQNRTFSSNWEPLLENEKIIIFTKYSDCSQPSQGFHFEYLLFKVENKTSQKLYITWDFDYMYDNQKRHEESDDEISVGLVVDSFKSVESSCLSKENKQMRLFVRDGKKKGVRELTDFSITNLNVSNL